MAKAKKNNKNAAKKRKGAVGAPRPVAVLDRAAADYARLLADPCGAPLVHPIYPGGDAGFLFRAESFWTAGAATGRTSGVFHWTPGYANASNTELVAMTADAPTVSTLFAAQAQAPGIAFLAANAKGCRCVAACLKITYPGAEQTRSGRVHYGLTQAGMIDAGDSTTVDAFAQTLQHYGRTPTDTVEVIWRPGAADTEFNDPKEAASQFIRDRKTAVSVAWAGLPAATGLTFHMTAIYEWTPNVGLGVGHNAVGKARSRNSLDDVIDAMVARGETFVRGLAYAGGAAASGAVVDLVRGAFGLMPAGRATRSVRQLTY